MRLITSFLLIAAAAIGPAGAMIGTKDTENKYPYVVRLGYGGSDTRSFCSGVTSPAGIVSTAAHCVWDYKRNDEQALPR
jgi:secreted trypsin-like serine protease